MVSHDIEVEIRSDISKNLKDRLHTYVNLTKEFMKNGYTSHGRSFHVTFALEHRKVLTVGFNNYRKIIGYVRGYGNLKHFEDEVSPYRMCLHSEMDTMFKLGRDFDYSSVSFFNVHLDRNLHCKNSRPCPNCLYTLMGLGAKRIYFYDEKDNCFKYIKL